MSRTRYPWLALARKSQAEPPARAPIWLGARSNGEYFHPQTRSEHAIERIVLERADAAARKLGIDRREFLASSMGMLTTLAAINQVSGCGGSNGDGMMDIPADGVSRTGGTGGGDATAGSAATGDSPSAAAGTGGMGAGPPPVGQGMGGGDGPSPSAGQCAYVVPREATCAETDLLSGEEFIFDVQTHSFDDGEWRTKNSTYASFLVFLARCSDAAAPLDCFDENHYGKYMFVDSDTTMSVITSWPAQLCTDGGPTVCGLPLSNEGMRHLRDSINERTQSQRVVNQVQVMPNDRWELQRDVMTMAAEDPSWGAVSWKAYPAWGPSAFGIGGAGYFLDDEVGRQFVEHGLSLGIPNFAIHKGLPIPGFDVEHNQPIEIGRVAKAYPEANFIIYHSGIGAGTGSLTMVASGERTPFDETVADPRQHTGVNQLLAALRESGVGAGGNVYAEMGSAWSNVMNDAVAAQHYVGKLLKHLGPDNVVWGTDCILYGSPQPQIEAFRMFQITEEFQQTYGYPALTAEVKAKIFGLNAARIFCVDPAARRCAAATGEFAQLRRAWDADFGPRRWTSQEPLGPTSRREFLALARFNLARKSPG